MTPAATFGTSSIEKQFKQVTKVIKARAALQEERQVFFVQLGGFDTHNNLADTVETKMGEIDAAIKSFEEEMTTEGVWDKTTVLTASDFGRTLRSNGAGTDHAWGGNYFMVGGGLQPNRIHGHFPKDLSEESDVNVRTGGRLIPTTSWDAVWYGLAQWMGVPEDKMGHILPNIGNWDKARDFMPKEQIFK
eukprot:g1415.t1